MRENMDAVPRFGSVRHKKRPIVRRPSFRDDMNLVAIRYEKTAWGDAPIPVTTINPVRSPLSRPTSSASSRSRSNSRSGSSSPIVVRPPPGSVPPPTEEHPALRQRPVLLPRTTTVNEWKRDSGHGATASASSTPTINEEDCEDCWDDLSPLSSSPTKPVVSAFGVVQQDLVEAHEQDADGHSSVGTPAVTNHELRPTSPETIMSDPGALPRCPASPAGSVSARRPMSSASVSTRQARSLSVTRPATASPRKNLVKSFSLRSVSSLSSSLLGRADAVGSNIAAPKLGSSSDASVSAAGPTDPPNKAAATPATPMQPLQPLLRGSQAPEAADEAADGAPTGTSTGASTTAPTGALRHSPQNLLSSLWKRGPFSPSSPRSPSHHDRRDDASPDPDAAIFSPLSISLPSEGLLDDDFLAALSFSKRGSVMFGSKRALSLDGTIMHDQQSPSPSCDQPRPSSHNGPKDDGPTATPASESVSRSESALSNEIPHTGLVTPDAVSQTQTQEAQSQEPVSDPQEPQAQSQTESKEPEPQPESQPQQQPQQQYLSPPPDIRVMAADVDRESQKVRSLYAVGDAIRWEDGGRPSSLGEQSQPPIEEAPAEDDAHDPSPSHLAPSINTTKSADSSSLRPSSAHRKETELAGGYEDWEDLDGAIVDRYGFITAPSRPASSRLATPTETKSSRFSPRKSRRNVLQKREAPDGSSPLSDVRPPSRKVSARSLNTQHSGKSIKSFRSHRSVIRQASNLLPHNRDRRWMDEAGDMLTVSPSLQDLAEEARVEKITEALKRKEWERSEKWRKMAKNVKKGAQGEGMEFEFDVKNPKLIERTWKGVPDCWRSAAWWSFLDVSAKNNPGSPSTEEIIADFHRLQENSSPDDVQIDLDVPRTIGRHIMFRRRYQGGQRLLFRVLHALSIYFPATGYVQGMAPLGATLLCYFDEERCFVMLVRMWQLRGLERLYRHGFEGLMAGLREFEGSWLHKDVAKHLTEQGIDPTAYGTRWYLTLFNLSIPFPAQLRVWDVFLLLDTGPTESTPVKTHSKKSAAASTPSTGLDILHAASAALVQALRDLLLDSDFENAMKALTSFIPIKDEDLLMKVAKAEWKAHQRKKKA